MGSPAFYRISSHSASQLHYFLRITITCGHGKFPSLEYSEHRSHHWHAPWKQVASTINREAVLRGNPALQMEEGDMRGSVETSAATGLETYVNGHSSGDQNGEGTHGVGKNVAANARVQRRRTSKACDHCNSSRRKCDGHKPCGYCVRKHVFLLFLFWFSFNTFTSVTSIFPRVTFARVLPYIFSSYLMRTSSQPWTSILTYRYRHKGFV